MQTAAHAFTFFKPNSALLYNPNFTSGRFVAIQTASTKGDFVVFRRLSWSSHPLRRRWNQSASDHEGYISNNYLPEFQQKEFDEWIAESGQEESTVNMFEEWMLIHGRVYEDVEEKITRYLNFKETLQVIEAYNNGEGKKTGTTLGLDSYSDYTHEEYVLRFLNRFERFC